MARMVRKQICITAELDRRLEEMASHRRVSQSEVVRDALVAYIDEAVLAGERRQHATDRFLALAEEIRRELPADYRRLTREEMHDRALLRRLERADLPGGE